MKLTFVAFALFLLASPGYSQLANGSTAPDFTVTTIDGNSYTLYDMMGANKAACLDFMATWCGPCWTFKTSGVMEQVYSNLLAETTVIMIEADWNTNTNCLYGPAGCNNTTQGDWVTGTPYPITDLSSTNGPTVKSDYSIAYYPTLYVISPDKRTWLIKSRSYSEYFNWITKSFKLNATANVVHSQCGDNGKITLAITGGYGSLTYKWSNGATTKDLSNLPGGSYSVTITDQNQYFKAYGPYEVEGPSKRVAVTGSQITHVACFGDASGSVYTQVDYGTPPYAYSWSNGQTGPDLLGVKSGPYGLTVTDLNGCTTTKSYTLNQPTLLKLSASATKESCDQVNGSILAKGSGGVAPYEYDMGFGKQSNPYFEDLYGGTTYGVTVTDANGCNEQTSVFVDVTHKPAASAGGDKDLDCIQDTIWLDGSMSETGTEIEYLWTTKNGHIVRGADEIIPDVDLPGLYVIKVQNRSTQCVAYDSVEVIDQRVFPDKSAVGDTVLNCLIQETSILGKSKDKQVNFYWLKVNDTAFVQKGDLLKASDSGKFVLHVLDTINLCISRDTVEVTSDTEKPLAAAEPEGYLNCLIKEIAIDGNASSQGPQFAYSWTTNNGLLISGEHSLFPTVGKAGDYDLEVSNLVNFCKESVVVTVEEQAKPEAVYGQSIDVRSVQFQDQSIGIPDRWLWQFGDATTSLERNPTHTYAADGAYEVCLEVENNCGNHQTCKTLLVGISSVLTLANWELSHVRCHAGNDGQIALSVQGGLPPYQYSWSNGAQTDKISSLEAGTYAVTISDQQGTVLERSFEIRQPAAIAMRDVTIVHAAAGKADGSIHLDIIGGISPYSFIWSDGQTSNPASGLAPGNYTCTIDDSNNCQRELGPFEVKELVADEQVHVLRELTVQPNPGRESVLKLQLSETAQVRLSIFDVLSGLHFRNEFYGQSLELPLGTLDMKPGIYFLAVEVKGEYKSLRWVVTE